LFAVSQLDDLIEAPRRERDDIGDPPMPDLPLNIADIDERIAILRENLRELVEQSSSYSGAADDDLMSRRIAEQEAELELLTKRRDELSQTRS
jgi:hypothetical protein